MEESWTTVIRPQKRWGMVSLRDLFHYRDLIFLFVKRNLSVRFKQTVLGPLWLLISPLLSTLVSTFVFGHIAKINSGEVPYAVFYFCGFTIWSYFSGCLNATASTFLGNAHLFGKVYFPRIVMPVSSVLTCLLTLCTNGILLVIFMVVYALRGAAFQPNLALLLVPFLVAETAALGMGVGIICSSLTVKYRDLNALIGLGIDLWKYVTPVIYMTASLGDLRVISLLNPMAPIVEAFRYACLGAGGGGLLWGALLISLAETAVLLTAGLLLFGRVEKTFIDTV